MEYLATFLPRAQVDSKPANPQCQKLKFGIKASARRICMKPIGPRLCLVGYVLNVLAGIYPSMYSTLPMGGFSNALDTLLEGLVGLVRLFILYSRLE